MEVEVAPMATVASERPPSKVTTERRVMRTTNAAKGRIETSSSSSAPMPINNAPDIDNKCWKVLGVANPRGVPMRRRARPGAAILATRPAPAGVVDLTSMYDAVNAKRTTVSRANAASLDVR